ncbi:hypothetical protein [Rhizobium lentis]|uniref:hypothetical protein n=1 Tax=Rhizobium lentis TaxID=1138194 RepID=UPI00287F4BF7|nr:hypothetical protein [Rhizobium lentis]
MHGFRQGSPAARRYGLSRSLLTRWSREYRSGLLVVLRGRFSFRWRPRRRKRRLVIWRQDLCLAAASRSRSIW